MIEDDLFFLSLPEEVGRLFDGKRFLVLKHNGSETGLDKADLHGIICIDR